MISIVKELGPQWLLNRSLYSLKLKTLNSFSWTEKIYEKKVEIKQLNIIEIDVQALEDFYAKLDNIEKLKIIKDADSAIMGRVKGFSNPGLELDYGSPINWHMHPITKVEEPSNQKWYQIADFKSERGDIKLIWEISRFTHIYLFIKAYLITKDQKYYQAFSEQIESWLQSNKYSYGSNYKCGQEATLRMINILYGYSVFNYYQLIGRKDLSLIKQIVTDSYRKILSNFFYAHKCIRNNHTLSEITGLIIGAWCSEDRSRLKDAIKLLNSEIHYQFSIDGGYKQFSFNYQRFALQLMEFNLMISNKIENILDEVSIERIKNSAKILYQVNSDNGRVPNYGANDGSLIFPFTLNDYTDYRPIINTINYLLTNKILFQDKYINEEILWFTKNKISKGSMILERKSSSFPFSGIHTLVRGDWKAILVSNDYKTRPVHRDQNHLDLWYKNYNVFCDLGSYSYASQLGAELTSTSSHNTVKVSNIEMMNKKGKFLVYKWTSRKYLEHTENTIKSIIISKNNYTHKREMELFKENLRIIDKVSPNQDFIINFHTPYSVEKINNDIFIIIDKQLKFLLVSNAKIVISDYWQSLYYYNKSPVKKISIIPAKNQNEIITDITLIESNEIKERL